MLVAVTLWEVLAKYLPKEKLTIKWPNDIYFGDKKLVGILIENILIGKHVGYSIAGIGVNVNQTQWRSDAPNPISMKEIMGQEFEAEALMNEWISSMKLWENCRPKCFLLRICNAYTAEKVGICIWNEK